MRSPRQSGLTLLEILLAVGVFALVGALLIPVFLGASRTANVQTGVDVADRNSARLIEELRTSLRSARVDSVSTSPDLPGITYRLPAEVTDLDEDGEVLWGPQRTLAFEPVETIRESDRGIDINGDGDRSDRFLRCRLTESVAGGAGRALSGSSFVLDADSPYGDVDGDGETDRPFTAIPGGLRVTLWSLIRSDVTGLRRARAEITLRNPQGDGEEASLDELVAE
jgi:type II secretory pathway pseudopilin PulG